jgi:hypothetical protein
MCSPLAKCLCSNGGKQQQQGWNQRLELVQEKIHCSAFVAGENLVRSTWILEIFEECDNHHNCLIWFQSLCLYIPTVPDRVGNLQQKNQLTKL